ncbi:MAG: hypothetical protein NWQ13_11135 [Glaciimonas sp.]|nr:hypothetical protein [Glaciimonas sp.]
MYQHLYSPAQPHQLCTYCGDFVAIYSKPNTLNLNQMRLGVGSIVKEIDKERNQSAVGQLRTKPLYAQKKKHALHVISLNLGF